MKNYTLWFVGIIMLLNIVVSHAQIEGSFDSKYHRYSQNETFEGEKTTTWKDTGWKGERINTQLILWSDVNVQSFTVSHGLQGNLRNELGEIIPATNISFHSGVYIVGDQKSGSCGVYPEHNQIAMISDGLNSDIVSTISPNDPLKLWISVDIPSNISAGLYTGGISILSTNGGLYFPVQIRVLDKVLPPPSEWSFHLDLWQYPYQLLKLHNDAHPEKIIVPWSTNHFELLRPFYTYLSSMGQKAITAHIKGNALGGPSMIKWIKNSNGTWSYDYSNFENYINFMSQLGISTQINCFSLIGWNEHEIPYYDSATR